MDTTINLSTDGHAWDANQFVSELTAVLGVRGSGKSNTASALVEELLDKGVPIVVVDLEGEYWGLRSDYELLIVGDTQRADLSLSPPEYAVIAERSLREGLSVILDFSNHPDDERMEACVHYFDALWNLADELRRPYIILIEEAHEYVGQNWTGDRKFKDLFSRIALRGRKRGLGAVLVSQRSAKVDKDVLSQATVSLYHRATHPIDINFYKGAIKWGKGPKDVETTMATFSPGDCFCQVMGGPWEITHIREQRTFHAGFSPKIGQASQAMSEPQLIRIKDTLLQELSMAADALEQEGSPYQSKWLAAEKRMLRLERENAALREKLLETEARLDIVSHLQVDPASLAEGLLCGTSRNGHLAPPLSDETLQTLAFQLGQKLGWDKDMTKANFEKVAGVKFDELTGARLQATVRRLERRVQAGA
jgi:hypothetical protein